MRKRRKRKKKFMKRPKQCKLSKKACRELQPIAEAIQRGF